MGDILDLYQMIVELSQRIDRLEGELIQERDLITLDDIDNPNVEVDKDGKRRIKERNVEE